MQEAPEYLADEDAEIVWVRSDLSEDADEIRELAESFSGWEFALNTLVDEQTLIAQEDGWVATVDEDPEGTLYWRLELN